MFGKNFEKKEKLSCWRVYFPQIILTFIWGKSMFGFKKEDKKKMIFFIFNFTIKNIKKMKYNIIKITYNLIHENDLI